MSLDVQSAVYGAWWSRMSAGVASFNAALPSGSQRVATLQLTDDRTDARVRAGLTAGAPAGYPRFRLQIIGGEEPKMKATFGQLANATGCDAIQELTITMLETIIHDTSVIGNANQTPLEKFIDAATKASPFPAMGLVDSQSRRYVNSVNVSTTRKDEKIDGAMHTVRRRTIRIGMRLHLSELQ